MDEIAGWDARYVAIRAVAGVVDDSLQFLTSSDQFSRRQVAAAYLARCRRLLEGLDQLRSIGMPDLAALPLRPFWECWVRGMWILLGGEAALDEAIANYKLETERHDRLARLELPGIGEWRGQGKEARAIDQVARDVGACLEADGDVDAKKHMSFAYDLLYRNESARNLHGGLAAVLDHLEDQGVGRLGVRARRRESGTGQGELLVAAVMLSMFARRVLLAFGIDVTPLDRVSQPLEEVSPSR